MALGRCVAGGGSQGKINDQVHVFEKVSIPMDFTFESKEDRMVKKKKEHIFCDCFSKELNVKTSEDCSKVRQRRSSW